MKSLFPEVNENWVFKIEVGPTRLNDGKKFISYKPVYMQHPAAWRELEESVFIRVFFPEQKNVTIPFSGSIWLLNVIVNSVDINALTVDYSHVGKDGTSAGNDRRMSLHVFRSSFRRAETPQQPDSVTDGSRQESSQYMPKRGCWYTMNVAVVEVFERDGKTLVKYRAIGNEQDSAPRFLEEKVFRSIFEPIDGAISEIRPNDEWFMMVEVTDYDPDESSVWYRQISSSGEHKGAIRHLSDHIFPATFRPAR